MSHDVPAAAAGRIVVPFAGVVSPLVTVGDHVEAGQIVASVEAMKMEAAITAPTAGIVQEMRVVKPCRCEGGDLLLILTR